MGDNFDPQSLHKYAYCHGDPVNGIDPSGLFTLIEILIVAGIVGIVSALVAGTINKVMGGSFWEGFVSGFISGFITTFLMLAVPNPNPAACAAVGSAVAQGVIEIWNWYRHPEQRDITKIIVRMIIAVVVGYVGGMLFAGRLSAVDAQAEEIAAILADKAVKENIDTLMIEVSKSGGVGAILGLIGAAVSKAADLAFILIDKIPKIFNRYTQPLTKEE